MDKIDIVITTWNRSRHTRMCLDYLKERTPLGSYRLIVVDNGSRDTTRDMLIKRKQSGEIDILVLLDKNYGLEIAKNIGLGFVESDYFVDSDNDILVPELEPSWLQQEYDILQRNSDFGAIALRPQILIGVGPIFKNTEGQEVVENNVAGGVMRMMRTDLVRKLGWDKVVRNDGRGQEEFDICSKIRAEGFKVGYCTKLWAYHIFGSMFGLKNWGYMPGQQGKRVLTEAPDDVPFDSLTCEPEQHNNE